MRGWREVSGLKLSERGLRNCRELEFQSVIRSTLIDADVMS